MTITTTKNAASVEACTVVNCPEQHTAWYLLQCKPQQGFRAEQHLRNQGYTCFYPVMTVERLRHGQRTQQVEPLFPGYAFIHLGRIDNWSPIRSTRGVSRIVSFNGQPMPVADHVITQLHNRIAEQISPPVLQPGDTVMLSGGAFDGLEAIFQCFDGEQRAIILLNLLQRQQQAITLPVAMLRKKS
jgi:transcriptional antiterminator RfaH